VLVINHVFVGLVHCAKTLMVQLEMAWTASVVKVSVRDMSFNIDCKQNGNDNTY
jgi:hypothetical protein